MSTCLNIPETASLLRDADTVLILTHQFPDGDTLGSGFALCRGLLQLGKKARVACAHPIPERYRYLTEGIHNDFLEPDFICAVDIANAPLLGSLDYYADKVDLAIDHHAVYAEYARYLLRDPEASAAAVLIYQLLIEMGVTLDVPIAEAIYTGIATDTGCFRFSNTNAGAHRIAAALLELPVRYEFINYLMFDMKSRARMTLEQSALAGMLYYFGGRCAVMPITLAQITLAGADKDDLEGVAAIPRQVEGVWVGITLREQEGGCYKISMRSDERVDVAAICAGFGGGGHVRAAGCNVDGTLEQVTGILLEAIARTVPKIGDECAMAP
ncbi:MAG: bifunctional oligoribonuclease/PAP phosphatase NrnA [Oscillospiraceae bacterium]|nr:bifunctional oligoribonuclease/PAP phosphatase NrnA [Oscillospiraceae bacterium]